MQFSLCECFCHTENVCVYRIEIFAKNSRKKFAKSSEARFLQCFSRIFCKYWDPIHTHIWSVAKAWTHTKLHSSKNKVPSEILHLIVDDSFCHLYALIEVLDVLYKGGIRPTRYIYETYILIFQIIIHAVYSFLH